MGGGLASGWGGGRRRRELSGDNRDLSVLSKLSKPRARLAGDRQVGERGRRDF